MSMKVAPTVDTTKMLAALYTPAKTFTQLGSYATPGTDGGVGQVLYSQTDHTYFVDKGTHKAAPTVSTSGTLADFFAAHAGHALTHIGSMARNPQSGEFADSWYCQVDKVVRLDVTT